MGEQTRAVLSTALIVFGAVFFMLGVVGSWAWDSVFDPDRFTGNAVRAVQHPDVRAEIERVLVDQIITLRQDLITVRPMLEIVVDSVVGSSQFRKILTVAALEVHRTLFVQDSRTLVLDISDAMTVILGGLKAFDPKLAESIPPDLQAGLITISDHSYAAGLASASEELEVLVVVLLLAGVVAMAAGVAVSPRRRGAIAAAGIAVALSALLTRLGLDLGRQALLNRFQELSTERAVAGVWDTYMEELLSWLWIIGGAGVMLAAAASATLTVADMRPRLLALRRRLTTLPESRWGQLAYAATAFAAGALMVMEPGTVVDTLVRGAGLVALYFAGVELLHLTGLAARAETAPDGQAVSRVTFNPRPLGVAGGAALLLLVGFGIWLNRDALRSDSIAEAAPIDTCNGYAELCDRRLNEVAFAATHNSMSSARQPGWYFALHDGDILRQLQDGIRAFLIDTHYGFPVQHGVVTDLERSDKAQRVAIEAELGPEVVQAANRLTARLGRVQPGAKSDVYLCHGFCELGATPLTTGLEWYVEFLKANPNEVLILFFEDYVTPEDMERAFVKSGLIDEVYTYTPGSQWPTLREMIAQHHRVLVLSEKVGNKPRPAWYHDGFALAQETPYTFKALTDFNCLPGRGTKDGTLFQLNHWFDTLPSSPGDAALANAYDFLLERAQRCQKERGLIPNIVGVNFYQIGDLLRVVDTLNGVGQGNTEKR